MYSVKANLDHEEMVVFVLSVFLVPLVGVSALYVSVNCIVEKEADLPAGLPHFNLNCSSKVRDSTNTWTYSGWEIFSREPGTTLSSLWQLPKT